MNRKNETVRSVVLSYKFHISWWLALVLAVAGAVAASLLPPLVLGRVVDRLTARQVVPFALALGYFGLLALSGGLESLRESLLTVFGQLFIIRSFLISYLFINSLIIFCNVLQIIPIGNGCFLWFQNMYISSHRSQPSKKCLINHNLNSYNKIILPLYFAENLRTKGTLDFFLCRILTYKPDFFYILSCLGGCRSTDLCRCFRFFSNLFLHIFRFLSCFAIRLMYYRIIRFCFI